MAEAGTWNVAKKMVKRLPAGIPRVSLSAESFPPGKSLLYPIRKYDAVGEENDNRVCTYEAVLAYQQEVGAITKQQREQLLWNLKARAWRGPLAPASLSTSRHATMGGRGRARRLCAMDMAARS